MKKRKDKESQDVGEVKRWGAGEGYSEEEGMLKEFRSGQVRSECLTCTFRAC